MGKPKMSSGGKIEVGTQERANVLGEPVSYEAPSPAWFIGTVVNLKAGHRAEFWTRVGAEFAAALLAQELPGVDVIVGNLLPAPTVMSVIRYNKVGSLA